MAANTPCVMCGNPVGRRDAWPANPEFQKYCGFCWDFKFGRSGNAAPPPLMPVAPGSSYLPPPTLDYAPPSSWQGITTASYLKMCICRENTLLFGTLDPQAQPLRGVLLGEIVELGAVAKGNGITRVEVTLLDGTRGYLPAEATVFRIRAATLQPGKTPMYVAPSKNAPVIDTLRRGAEIILVDQVPAEGGMWSEIRDVTGRIGYIDGGVKVIPVAAPAKQNSAGRDMLVGLVLCVIGIAITAGTYSSVSTSGGTYVVAWGPVVFGGIQFLKGLANLGSSGKPPPVTTLQRMLPGILEQKSGRRLGV